MSIVWTIEELRCLPQAEGQTKVVTEVHWRCVGTKEQDGQTHCSGEYGVCHFIYKGGDFTNYDSLTADDVLNWVWDSDVEKTEIEARINLNIANLLNPPVVVHPLPWSQA